MKNVALLTTASILALAGCGGSSDPVEQQEDTIDLATTIVTGADESSSAFWDCTFVSTDDPTSEQLLNTVTFWQNGRGITGSGLLYSWVVVNDQINGTYDSGDRIFTLENFAFTDTDNFTALNVSTRNVGSSDESVASFNATCARSV